MKNCRILLWTLSVIIFFGFSFSLKAQNAVSIKIADESIEQQTESYPIDARPLLEKFSKANGIDLTKAPAMQQLRKSAWNFVVGSQKNWYASDMTNNQFYSVSSTCRAVGTNAYIFVEDSLWNSRVDQNAVDKVQEAFDSKIPADANKGIFQTNVETFGNPPNVDGDSKIIILILNIRDGYTGTGGYTAGYFYGYNQYAQANSNFAEIFYLDANPLNLKTPNGLAAGMNTLAHEFQHMIHFNYDRDEYTFVNEGMSLMAEYINGYQLREQGSYNKETNFPLFEWRDEDNTKVLTDYSRAARFSLYLYEQFGKDVLKRIVQETANETNGINNALSKTTPSTLRRFKDILEDWFVANIVNDKSFNNFYGYTESKVGYAGAREHLNPNVNSFSDGINKYGVQYISFTGGSNLSIKFDTKGMSEIKIKAIKFGATKFIEEINPAATYNVPDFGTTYNKITFAVYISDGNVFVPQDQPTFPFSYTASGKFENKPIEIAYDKSEPTGVLPLTAGDSVAVYFGGIAGAKLDSIRIALRQAGSVTGGVWQYTGAQRPTPLGKKLAVPIVATSTIAQKPGTPYPVPWPNWVKVDLGSYNIDASNSFVVAFLVEGTYPEKNRIMVTEKTGTEVDYSYTYLNSPSGGGSPAWYYLTTQNSGVYQYLIRAYISLNPTGVKEVVELMPSSFSLAQNYPNPFNPSTNISYRLQGTSYTTLRVYDMLGREVATLVNEEQPAGTYQIVWNGTDNFGNKVTSGVYIYRLQAGSFSQTKKLVLMK
ncbi:MAG: T9SS type A sorting domain-containing protein [Bacteroidota bacterium]